jgi:hypothetical protein
MSSLSGSDKLHLDEVEWRNALVEAERARVDAADHRDGDEADEYGARRRWLRLWRAERRLNELMRLAD